MTSIVISGTDPSNPHTMREVVDQLEQIHREIVALRDHALKVAVFAGSARSVLDWQGSSPQSAQALTREFLVPIRRLAARLDDAALPAGIAVGLIVGSNVNMQARFSDVHEWERARYRGRR